MKIEPGTYPETITMPDTNVNDKLYIRKITRPVLAFRIGIDPIPNWAMDKISANKIILHSPTENKSNGPFDHRGDTFAEIECPSGMFILVLHGCYIVNENDRLMPYNEDTFNRIFKILE